MKDFPILLTHGVIPHDHHDEVVFAVTDPMYRFPLGEHEGAYVEWSGDVETSGWLAHVKSSQGDGVASLCEKMGPIVHTGWFLLAGVGFMAKVAKGSGSDCVEQMKKVLCETIGPIEPVPSNNLSGLKGHMLLTFLLEKHRKQVLATTGSAN